MFWRAKSPIDGDDEEWQLEYWRWLLTLTAASARSRSGP
jgi:hypothetical protein